MFNLEQFATRFFDFFKKEQAAIVNYIISTDQTLTLTNIRAVSFVNKDEETVFVNRLPIKQNESISYNTDSHVTMTESFDIVFSNTGGTKKLYITTIK